jgi:hypothetical protein
MSACKEAEFFRPKKNPRRTGLDGISYWFRPASVGVNLEISRDLIIVIRTSVGLQ